MRINEEPQKDQSSQSLIRTLLWMTLAYSISYLGYLGRNQGLWFWYVSLRHPAWDLPTWAFTPIQTVVTGLIAMSLPSLAEFKPKTSAAVHIGLALLALCLMATDGWIYFAKHMFVGSLVAQVLAGLCLAALVGAVRKSKPNIALWFVLCLLAQTFQIALVYATWKLNP